MTWQEYQEAVALLYEQMDGIGIVQRDARIPDRISGQHRQVDVMIDLNERGHSVRLLVDAKFHASPIDTKVVEEVVALADAVGACKSIIVCPNGWTTPAEIKAEHVRCDLRLLTLEEALDLFLPDKWMICDSCKRDCIVMDQNGMVEMHDGSIVWWLGGACRECHYAIAWCQDCGIRYHMQRCESITCHCGYHWNNDDGIIHVAFPSESATA